MANEDPAGIPEQFRQNRPFFAVLILALLLAIGTFLFVLSRDTESTDLERNLPPNTAETPAQTTEIPAPPPAPATAQ